jgi:hypothetical protein
VRVSRSTVWVSVTVTVSSLFLLVRTTLEGEAVSSCPHCRGRSWRISTGPGS